MFWEIVLTSLAIIFAIMVAGEVVEFVIRSIRG